jgi:antitoxin component HigA of HigAB toxin-antitoxin module
VSSDVSTVRGRELGSRLRDAMDAAGLTAKRLSVLIGHDSSRVSRLLSGRRGG